MTMTSITLGYILGAILAASIVANLVLAIIIRRQQAEIEYLRQENLAILAENDLLRRGFSKEAANSVVHPRRRDRGGR